MPKINFHSPFSLLSAVTKKLKQDPQNFSNRSKNYKNATKKVIFIKKQHADLLISRIPSANENREAKFLKITPWPVKHKKSGKSLFAFPASVPQRGIEPLSKV